MLPGQRSVQAGAPAVSADHRPLFAWIRGYPGMAWVAAVLPSGPTERVRGRHPAIRAMTRLWGNADLFGSDGFSQCPQ